MKILHIQTGMSLAGNAAYRLHLKMLDCGIESRILTYMPAPNLPFVSSTENTLKLFLNKAFNYFYIRYRKSCLHKDKYFYSILPLYSKGLTNNYYVQQADVIYFHSICGSFLSLEDIESLAKLGKPLIFFMHDMWTFTGGCHHSFECDNYQYDCSSCHMLKKGSYSKKQHLEKKRLFEKYDNLFFISPSTWMANKAKQSNVLRNKNIYVIPNVVDENIFKPLSKNIARYILNIPLDKKIITFGCQAGTSNPYKGWAFLRDAINLLQDENVLLLVYGSHFDKKTSEDLKYPVKFLGKINDEYVLSLICNATDVYVTPSLAESFGLTILENTLCNTPVVSFNCTAIPEVMHLRSENYLAEFKNSVDLSKGIHTILQDNKEKSIEQIDYKSEQIVSMHLQLIKNIKS